MPFTKFHVPIVGVVALICFITLQQPLQPDEKIYVPMQPMEKKSLSDLIGQFFGKNTYSKNQGNMAFQICMWATLIYINASMGSIFTILILLVAFLNFSATQYNRGYLGLHTCCSSYAYWFFSGAALAVLAYQFLKRRAVRTGSGVAVLGAVAILLLASYEKTVQHHAFPFLMGYLVAAIAILHTECAPVLHKRLRV